MTYALRDGLSFCTIEGRHLFLDLTADRYFCLPAGIEESFENLRRGGALSLGDLEDLGACGIVEANKSADITACTPPPAPVASLLHDRVPTPPVMDILAAAAQLVRSSAELKFMGLARTIARLRARKRRAGGSSAPPCGASTIARAAAAFQATGRYASIQDKCLPRSLAVAHRLLALGIAPELVLGVTLGPFTAHAWVQWGDVLVNERTEITRQFTPILVV
ncbi:transglutaminase superfamily protein [Novosphingobium sp. PhB55]|uniref:lasso peptide biosynthesis B2 protein n=1 Tax=Novosphingobium sp. PhB55 TaxID=2485106 RepID=UPI001064E4D6|nr:lasso peptide biosynthesis B2 protein [Novosphingobium sp. PhB55]TDW61558.1 transglutaminase superfamily protein [Novosphingobium sp. PhB55]